MLPVNIGKSKYIRTVPITSFKHKPLGQIQGELVLQMIGAGPEVMKLRILRVKTIKIWFHDL